MTLFKDAMTHLFVEVFKAYVERKDEKILVPQNPNRVIRGTSVSNASVFENQMGLLLHKQLHEDYRILIDYPIIFPGQNQRITPDILILRDNTIKMMLELKIDLGYEKDGWEKQKKARVDRLKENKFQTGYKPLNVNTLLKEDKVLINVPDNIEYATVIFCHKNGAELIKGIVNTCKSHTSEDRGEYPFFILLKDTAIHPNDFTSIDDAAVYISKMSENDISDWHVFEKYLRNRLEFNNM